MERKRDMDGNKTGKGRKTLYAVDAYVTFAKCFRVEAKSRKDAIAKVESVMECLFSAPEETDADMLKALGFHYADDCEIKVSGKADRTGEIAYF